MRIREEEFRELCNDAETLRDRVSDANSDIRGIVTAAMGLAIRMACVLESTLEGDQKDQWQAIHASPDLLWAEVALIRNEIERRPESNNESNYLADVKRRTKNEKRQKVSAFVQQG